jgi:uncharacterized protein (UPF0333 family)
MSVKKAQITLFLVVAVIMVAAFGYGFYYLIHSNDTGNNAAS